MKNQNKHLKCLIRYELFGNKLLQDGGGTISPDEIKQVLGFDASFDQKVINDIIKEVDENGDGEIQFDEFVHMMRKFAIN